MASFSGGGRNNVAFLWRRRHHRHEQIFVQQRRRAVWVTLPIERQVVLAVDTLMARLVSRSSSTAAGTHHQELYPGFAQRDFIVLEEGLLLLLHHPRRRHYYFPRQNIVPSAVVGRRRRHLGRVVARPKGRCKQQRVRGRQEGPPPGSPRVEAVGQQVLREEDQKHGAVRR